ncbi:MAG: hypothetical protein LJE93_14525 [Acidobacteria bacterium]|nr:hypothetical protein [Acidobacteriota bacterium]
MAIYGGEFNLEAYQLMVEILVTARKIICRGLEKATGESWYLEGCSSAVFERMVARKEREAEIDRFDREYQELISFATLDDLADIIDFNQNLAKLLEGIAPEGISLADRFRQLEILRLKLAAAVPLNEEDLDNLLEYHLEFRRAISKPKKTAEAEVEGAPAGEEAEPAEDSGAPGDEPDELGADDVVTEGPSDVFHRSAMDAKPGEEAGDSAAGDESSLEVRRAIESQDDGAVLRVLHREIMDLAQGILKGDVDRDSPVWNELEATGWYAEKSEPLGLQPVEQFFVFTDDVRTLREAGESAEEIKAFANQAGVSKLLLELGEMFKRQKTK